MLADDLTVRARAAWADGLGMEVDGDTDFFDAGGTSLTAMRIIAVLSDAFATQIPLRALFDNSRFDDFVAVVAHGLVGVPAGEQSRVWS